MGFAIGDMTFGLLLEERGLMPTIVKAPDIYVVIGGELERKVAFGAISSLRALGYSVDYPFKDLGFGKQFKAAAESGAKLALIFGSDEVAKGSVKIRDMAVRSEEEIARSELESTVREFFSK